MKWDNFVTMCKEELGDCSPVVTRLWAGYLRNFGFMPGNGKRFVSFSEHTDQTGVHPAFYSVCFAGALFLR